MTPEHTALVARLAALHASKKMVPGIGGQQMGLEQYRIVASGNDLESIHEAAAALREQAGRLDAATTRSKEWATEFGRASGERDTLREALQSIAANTCCDKCQEAALVARAALADKQEPV